MAMARPRCPTPGHLRRGATLGRDRGGQDRQGQRRDDGATHALDGAGKRTLVNSGTARQSKSADKDGHPNKEHPLATEPVAERRARVSRTAKVKL